MKIVASDPQARDRLGGSVSISGDYAIVGAFTAGGQDTGAAYKRTGDIAPEFSYDAHGRKKKQNCHSVRLKKPAFKRIVTMTK
jgi:hypothetical protein